MFVLLLLIPLYFILVAFYGKPSRAPVIYSKKPTLDNTRHRKGPVTRSISKSSQSSQSDDDKLKPDYSRAKTYHRRVHMLSK